MSTTKLIYEKYKHLDNLLSDQAWLPNDLIGKMLYDLWQAVKLEQMPPKQPVEPTGVTSQNQPSPQPDGSPAGR